MTSSKSNPHAETLLRPSEQATADGRETANVRARPPSSSGERRSLSSEEAATAASSYFAEGAIVGDKYLVDGVLGQGGLGVVISATHLHLDQKVAIKYLRGTAPRERAIVDRFLREARLAAQIKSEHVVRVFDVATLPDGTPYMVMECLEGHDLRTYLEEQGSVAPDVAVDFLLQACEAVAEAHSQGIVHRDIKPDNLFLARQRGARDILKILDFGISKLSGRFTSSSRVHAVTQAGDRLGTPLYMSPEQLEGDPNVDARSDIWALGVVLYELCTGTMPFTGESLPAICTAVLTKVQVPPSVAKPGLPVALDGIVARCLAKSRADRYANVGELAQDLQHSGSPAMREASRERVARVIEKVVGGGDVVRPRITSMPPPPSTTSSAPTRPSTLSWGAIATAVLALAVVAAVASTMASRHPPAAAATHATPVAESAITTTTAIATASPPPVALPIALPAPVAPSASATAEPAPVKVAPAAPRAMVRPSAPAKSVAPADTTGVLDPFQ